MATVDEERNIIFSPIRKGDIIKVGGVSHHVIRPGHVVGQIAYMARNLETREVVKVPFKVLEDPKPPRFEVGVEEQDYFQIIILSPDEREATLKFLSEPYEEATFSLRNLDEEELKIIRDGLLREDKEVFCTVVKIMGKEMMGNIKCLPKDPPILKMPELVMDMIFSYLSKEDRLNCRLVDKYWAYELLPFRKFFVSLNHCSVKKLYTDPQWRGKVETLKLKNRDAIMDTSFLCYAEALSMLFINEDISQKVLECCHGLKQFEANLHRRPKYMLTLIQKLILNNKDHLQSVKIESGTKVSGDLDLKSLVGKCRSLKTLIVKMSSKTAITNVKFLPSSLSHLTLTDLSLPLKRTEIRWIASHLTNLVDVKLRVKHIHGDELGWTKKLMKIRSQEY